MLKGNKRWMVIGGFATFLIMHFKKIDNREKARTTLKNTKTKASSYRDSQKHKPTQMIKAGFSDPHDPDDNRMVEEGAMTSVRYYNKNVHDKTSKSEMNHPFPKSQKKILPQAKESLPGANNDSPAKQENTNLGPMA